VLAPGNSQKAKEGKERQNRVLVKYAGTRTGRDHACDWGTRAGGLPQVGTA